MTLFEARCLLQDYNKWRRDDHVPNQYEMPNPTELGKAIDIAIKAMGILLFGNNLEQDAVTRLTKELVKGE